MPRFAIRDGRQYARWVSIERLDLDDKSATLREQLRAVGDGDELSEFDDANTVKGAVSFHGR